jgi:hypothetical protein
MVVSGALGLAGCGGTSGRAGSQATVPGAVLSLPDPMLCADAAATASADPCVTGTAASASQSGAGGSATSSASSAASGTSPSTTTVPVGTDQTLPAAQENDTLAVAVTGVKQLAPGRANAPARGQHWLGVQLRYRNLGLTPFEDSPDNEVIVITDDGHQYGSALIDVRGCTNGGDITVAASATLRSCVAFQVPARHRVKRVLVSLDSGTGTPGAWTVP